MHSFPWNKKTKPKVLRKGSEGRNTLIELQSQIKIKAKINYCSREKDNNGAEEGCEGMDQFIIYLKSSWKEEDMLRGLVMGQVESGNKSYLKEWKLILYMTNHVSRALA